MIEQLVQYLPFIIPLAVIQLGLMLTAVIHIMRHDNYRVGSRALWLVVSLFINIIGPVLYLVIGRGDE